MRLLHDGQVLTVHDKATVGDVLAAAGESLFDSVVVHECRYLELNEVLEELGYLDGSPVRIERRPPPCIHGSPFDPARGGYLCGWC
jgi:hypothetical protein